MGHIDKNGQYCEEGTEPMLKNKPLENLPKVSKELFGVKNWLWKMDIANWQNVMQMYAHHVLLLEKDTPNDTVAKLIQKDFGPFVKWVKEKKEELRFK